MKTWNQLIVAALLWAAPAAAQTYNPPIYHPSRNPAPFPMPPSAELKQYISTMSAKVSNMPLRFKCVASVNTKQWSGSHNLEFGVDPVKKSAVLIGWTLLWDVMSHVPKETMMVNADHDLAYVPGLQVQISNQHYQISYAHTERDHSRIPPHYANLSLFEFIGAKQPHSLLVRIIKLQVDGKDLQMICHQ